MEVVVDSGGDVASWDVDVVSCSYGVVGKCLGEFSVECCLITVAFIEFCSGSGFPMVMCS